MDSRPAIWFALALLGCGSANPSDPARTDGGGDSIADGPLDGAGSDVGSTVCERSAMPGDLFVTELMFQAPYYAVWIELRNVSSCRIDIVGVGVRSRRDTPGGADDNQMIVPATRWIDSGERVVFSSNPGFPVVDELVNEPTETVAWLLTPELVFLERGAQLFQQLAMPENFAADVRYARALPEGVCATASPHNAATWPFARTAVAPNPVDPGQVGTPGAANDSICPL
ncbi:MAG TPA: hypothetical protein VIV11_10030 [Kofleriaceae bacterium]